MKTTEQNISMPRRQLLKHALLMVPALIAFSPNSLLAKVPERKLSFSHAHTGEKLSIVYAQDGRYLPESLNRINYLLRDFRRDEVCPIDPVLLDLLYDLQVISSNDTGTYEILSGYRSPQTNQMLAAKSNGVGKRSLHMQGKAIDLRLRGTRTSDLRRIALSLKRGGTGYYADSDFVHLDTGRVRWW